MSESDIDYSDKPGNQYQQPLIEDRSISINSNNDRVSYFNMRMKKIDILSPPIDIILNHRYLEGKFLNPKNPLDVFDGKIVAEENTENFQDLHNDVNDQDHQYKQQRPIQREDGMLHYYSSDQGKIWIDRANNVYNNKIEMLVSITMYNEDYNLLARSLGSVQKNLKEFAKIGVRADQVVVVVIQDGIEKINESLMENIFDKLDQSYPKDSENVKNKCYRERVDEIKKGRDYITNDMKMKGKYIDQNQNFPMNIPKNVALLYYAKMDFLKDTNYSTPLTLFFCNKHLNGKKLSSHTWLFQGFCRQFQPKYITLLDCGTQVDEKGIVEFYKAFENDPTIGGCSGNMNVYYDNLDELKMQKYRYNKVKQEIENEKRKLKGKSEKSIDKMDLKIVEKEIEYQEWCNKSWQEKYSGKHFYNYFLSIFRPVCCMDNYHRREYLIPKLEKELEQIRETGQVEKEDKGCFLSRFFKWIGDCIYGFFVNLHYFFDIRKYQENEYLMGQIIDRRYESFFNFLVILPGAWCSYKYDAIFYEGTPGEPSTIEDWYLRPVINKKTLTYSMEEQNILLGEDRVLTLATYLQKNCKFKLKNVPGARAQADAVDNYTELLLQRRRWINATWFSVIYVLETYFKYMRESKQPCLSKYVFVPMMLFFQSLQQVIGYAGLSFKVYMLYNLLYAYWPYKTNEDNNGWERVLALIPGTILTMYIFTFLLLILTCLTYKINKSNTKYKLYACISSMLSLFELTFVGLLTYTLVKNLFVDGNFKYLFSFKQGDEAEELSVPKFIVTNTIFINIGLTALPFLTSLLEFNWKSVKDVLQVAITFPSSLYYSASSQYVFLIYGFCNIDDLSWGTKGATEEGNQDVNKDRKNKFVLRWVVVNILIFTIFQYVGQALDDNIWLILSFVLILMTIQGFKCFFSALGMIELFVFKRPYYYCKRKKRLQQNQQQQQIPQQ